MHMGTTICELGDMWFPAFSFLLLSVHGERVKTSTGLNGRVQLVDKLLLNYGPKTILPNTNKHSPINVTMRWKPSRIVALDEILQKLVLSSVIMIQWRDDYLTWDPGEHSGINQVEISRGEVWLPDVVLFNNVDKKFTRLPIANVGKVLKVAYTGLVTWYTPIITTSKCTQEGYHFPLDLQNCNLTFGSWTFDATNIKLLASMEDDGKEIVFQTNKVWDMISFEAVSYERMFACCSNPWSLLDYRITFKRRPYFYLATVCFPCLLLSLLVLAIFWVPHEAGEKISMATSNLVALLLFHQLAAEFRPPSNGVQLFDIYVLTMIFLACTSVASSVLVRSLYFGKGKGLPPALLRRLTHSIFCSLLIEVSHTVDEFEDITNQRPEDAHEIGEGAVSDEFSSLVPDTWRSDSYDDGETSSNDILPLTDGGDDDEDDDECEYNDNNHDAARKQMAYRKRKNRLAIYIMLKKQQKKQWQNWQKVQAEETYKKEWKLLAKAIDRITFLLHLVLTGFITTYMYIEISSS